MFVFGFIHIILIVYFVFAIFGYIYLRGAYFPQFPTWFERFVCMVMACLWIITVPVTYLVKQEDGEEIHMETSYDGFLGREA